MDKYDVIVVGACTAGTYIANRIGKENHKVLVIDKDSVSDLSKRLDIFHFIYDCFKEFEIPETKKSDKEFVREFDTFYSFSALNNYKKTTHNKVYVMHLPLFIERLRKIAISNKVEFSFETEFKELIYDENNKICGLKAIKNGQEIIINTKMVIDASGIPSVVRKQINSQYIETFDIGPKDKFYVLLKYVELLDKNLKVETSTSWPFYKTWMAPEHSGKGAIIGVGASLSYDYARKCMDRFLSKIPLPKWKLMYEEMGCTPYRRPPLSFVSDNFLVIGDAACLTKPFNGEGVTACFTLAKYAGDIINECLNKNDFSVEALWKINVFYQSGEGAKYASERALIVGAINMNEKENDFLYKHSIVFKSDDEPEKDMVSEILSGLSKKEISLKAVLGLLKSSKNGHLLYEHYLNYPKSPEGYSKWSKKALKFWKKTGNISDKIVE